VEIFILIIKVVIIQIPILLSSLSITYIIRGNGLLVETSLAAYAWMNCYEKYKNYVDKAMNWIRTNCKDGSFGATQSTIITLKAIIRYDVLQTNINLGKISIKLNKTAIAEVQVTRDHHTNGKLEINLSKYIKDPMKYEFEFRTSDGLSCPYSFSVLYNTIKPDSSAACVVDLTTKLSHADITEGDGSEIFITITNLKNTGQPMVTAIIGLPGGLEPRHTQLNELVQSETIDYFEIKGREVVIYFREMGPKQEIKFKIDVEAKIPGFYIGPASRIYLYYTPEDKKWNDQLRINILPRS